MPSRKAAAAPRGKSGLFAKVCQAIWGTAFVAPAAKCCGVDRKQVRRWLDDVAPVPGYAWFTLTTTAHEQRDKLLSMAQQAHESIPKSYWDSQRT